MIKPSRGNPKSTLIRIDMAKQSGVAFLDFNADAAKLLK
jgi:hypothetical protein